MEANMRKFLVKCLLAPALVLAPIAAAHAETSVACMYMLMRVYKAEMDYCRVPLAKDRADRYERMKTGLEKFIRANAKVDAEKVISGIENDNIKRALAGLKSCQGDDFKYAAQAMDQITTADHEKMIQGTLGFARDPMQGDCSS
jgi:hypothetical protein